MYRKPSNQLKVEDFILPFSGYLNKNNRWVKMATIIPWNAIEEKYAELFADNIGNEAKSARVALGALIIKEKLGITDRETVDQIRENPYLQYFIGYKEYRDEPPFDHSLMVHFRKRFDFESMQDINDMICLVEDESKLGDHDEPPPTTSGHSVDKDENQRENKGKLILDATCAPADIRYPTDISLLNEAREKLEAIIDTLYRPLQGVMTKPRTYRETAHREYLKFAKQRKPRKKQVRKALRKQLGYVSRDLKHVEALIGLSSATLTNRQKEQLAVIQELYQQQQYMYDQKSHQVEDRIVSISQPHVRPIVRGKANASTEFGAKVAISLVNGYAHIDKLSWRNFNEGTILEYSAEAYRHRHGHYPEVIAADAIYRNRYNIAYCKANNIRLSGPKLGRPPLVKDKMQKEMERQDAKIRNQVEGKFGEGKRRYGLGLVMARLQDTSETVIALQFLVMNLEQSVIGQIVPSSKSHNILA